MSIDERCKSFQIFVLRIYQLNYLDIETKFPYFLFLTWLSKERNLYI